ncbi:MAG: PDZ domain-containing protein, partial [Sulfurimonas sp.]
VVKESNPFVKLNQLKVGDIILELDSKRVKDSASFMRDMLFGLVGSTHSIKVKRESKTLTLKAITQKRVDNVYLEFLGLSFDKNLLIIKIEKKAEHFGLKLGDRLLQANTKYIKDAQDIFDETYNLKNPLNLLFEREHFQFFVKVN